MKSFVLFITICLLSNVVMSFENDRPVFSPHEKVPELSNYADNEGENDTDSDSNSEAEELDDEDQQITEDGFGSSLGKIFQDSVTACSIM